ncbi:hypothetical protein niasHT_026451 [Heterodera trifolii]|uniref:Uncharacterized protein n=1 Tax=Heterodera trifolii TaxID=157864 RepID=A0ABD2KJI7_9BILA
MLSPKSLLFLFLFLLAFLFPSAQCLTLKRQKPSQLNRKNEELNAEKALNRTVAKLSTDGENGRLILLVCRGKCLKERAQIPNWLREFNTANNHSFLKRNNDKSISYDQSDRSVSDQQKNNASLGRDDELQKHWEGGVAFHFHAHRLPIPVMDIETALRQHSLWQNVLFYVVAGKAFPAAPEAVIREKNTFLDWLNSFEKTPIVRISDLVEMNEWLNSECHGDGLNKRRAEQQQMALLVVHDQFVCPEFRLAAFARSLFASARQSHSPPLRTNFTVLEALRPLTEGEELSLSARLPGLSRACRMLILLRANLFTELPQGISGSKMHQIIELWLKLPLATERCPGGNSALNLAPILGPLGAANLEFLREERILKAIEKKREYLAVGIIGGVAVMALAMSIFWGLNGNDFVTKP